MMNEVHCSPYPSSGLLILPKIPFMTLDVALIEFSLCFGGSVQIQML